MFEVIVLGIGDNIKKYRKQAGLTQKQLAERIGAATGTIQQYELGKREPRFEQITKIVNALGLKEEHELYGKDAWLLLVQGSADFAHSMSEQGYTFLEKERELIVLFNQMNDLGKDTAIERIRELTEIQKYRQKED